jgi:isoleucyl-tRNA synthetase
VLGASIHDVLARIKSVPLVYPSISLSHSQSHPLLAPVIITLQSNGLRLRFDGPEQRLRLIEVLDFSKTRLSYKGHDIGNSQTQNENVALNTHFNPPKTGPGFRSVYKIFGPTTPGEYLPPNGKNKEDGTYVLSYPGIAFSFPLKHGIWSSGTGWSSTVSLLSSNASKASTAMSVFVGESWDLARDSLFENDMSNFLRSPIASGIKKETVPKEVELVKVHDRGRVELVRKDAPSFWIMMGETTPQDLVTELGPPDSVHRRNDTRVAIHQDRRNSSASASRRGSSNTEMSPPLRNLPFDSDTSSQVEESDESDLEEGVVIDPKKREDSGEVFYNYYSHGFDIKVSNPLPPSTLSHASSTNGSGTDGPDAVVPRSHLVVTKILLHGNVPGSWNFNRHRRIRWSLDSVATADDPNPPNSEVLFKDIQHYLQQYFHDSYATEEERRAAALPMVVNRALGREELAADGDYGVIGSWEDGGTSSVRRLDQKTTEAEKIGGAEVYGFPGMVFEVLKNGTVSCLMVY